MANCASQCSSLISKSANGRVEPVLFEREEHARPRLDTVISRIFDSHSFPMEASQFATSVLVYAVIYRDWDIARYFDRGYESAHTRTSPTMGYLPAVPEYTNWRNKACDYLDILHWDALGNSAKHKGFEGPIFLKLHLARMVLLTPYRKMMALAQDFCDASTTATLPHHLEPFRSSISHSQCQIMTWRRKDGYKARLAVIHAGATFWHVRRYASDSFIQPFTIYLATLVLWCFADPALSQASDHVAPYTNGESRPLATTAMVDDPTTAVDPAQSTHETSPSLPSGLATNAPRTLNFDRPVDDELVQHFVRNDSPRMTLCGEGIDDLCSTHGARQILVEGVTILRASGDCVWPVSQKYLQSLEAIIHGIDTGAGDTAA